MNRISNLGARFGARSALAVVILAAFLIGMGAFGCSSPAVPDATDLPVERTPEPTERPEPTPEPTAIPMPEVADGRYPDDVRDWIENGGFDQLEGFWGAWVEAGVIAKQVGTSEAHAIPIFNPEDSSERVVPAIEVLDASGQVVQWLLPPVDIPATVEQGRLVFLSPPEGDNWNDLSQMANPFRPLVLTPDAGGQFPLADGEHRHLEVNSSGTVELVNREGPVAEIGIDVETVADWVKVETDNLEGEWREVIQLPSGMEVHLVVDEALRAKRAEGGTGAANLGWTTRERFEDALRREGYNPQDLVGEDSWTEIEEFFGDESELKRRLDEVLLLVIPDSLPTGDVVDKSKPINIVFVDYRESDINGHIDSNRGSYKVMTHKYGDWTIGFSPENGGLSLAFELSSDDQFGLNNYPSSTQAPLSRFLIRMLASLKIKEVFQREIAVDHIVEEYSGNPGLIDKLEDLWWESFPDANLPIFWFE